MAYHRQPFLCMVGEEGSSEDIRSVLEDLEESSAPASPAESEDIFEDDDNNSINIESVNDLIGDSSAEDSDTSQDEILLENAVWNSTSPNQTVNDLLMSTIKRPFPESNVVSTSNQPVSKKPRSSVWMHFDTTTNSDGKKSCTCKRCGNTVSAQAQRLQKHINKCNAKPTASFTYSQEQNLQSSAEASQVSAVELQSSSEKMDAPQKPIGNCLSRSLVKISTNEKKQLDLKLGRFMFSSNIPFNVLTNPYFQEFVKGLNPAYILPSRKQMSEPILNSIYEEVSNEMTSQLNGQKAVILQDGWSSSQNDPVISHCLQSNSVVHFLSAESAGTHEKNAAYCYELLKNAIILAETKYNCTVIGVVTDNNNTMSAMQSLVKKDYPALEAYGCNAHLFNLLGKRFTPQDTQDKVEVVQKFMKNHHIPSSELKALKGNRPVISTSTRWNSQLDSFSNYQDNHAKYLEIVRKMKKPIGKADQIKLDSISQILNDSSVYAKVTEAISVLKPISIALDVAQQQSSTIADIVEQWVNLQDKLPPQIRDSEYFKKQLKIGLTAMAAAANIIHPKYRGMRLKTDQKNLGLNWISEKNSNFILYAAEMANISSPYFYDAFQKDDILKSMSPVNWWNAASTQLVDPAMIELASGILAMPSGTGSLERCFSKLGNILSKKRSRLGIEKGSKLCCINNSLGVKVAISRKKLDSKKKDVGLN